jgi:hypothetical protein
VLPEYAVGIPRLQAREDVNSPICFYKLDSHRAPRPRNYCGAHERCLLGARCRYWVRSMHSPWKLHFFKYSRQYGELHCSSCAL